MVKEIIAVIIICTATICIMAALTASSERKKPQPRDSRGRFTKRKD